MHLDALDEELPFIQLVYKHKIRLAQLKIPNMASKTIASTNLGIIHT